MEFNHKWIRQIDVLLSSAEIYLDCEETKDVAHTLIEMAQDKIKLLAEDVAEVKADLFKVK